ncbi:MAG: SMI1/KNR4 family protein [Chitinophagaceae bacterium]
MTPHITDIITRIQRDKIDLGITLYDKTSLSDISSFEQTMSLSLPDDIKTFYSFCNGFESAEDMFRVLPLNEIIENISNGRDTYLVDKKDLHLAEYMIYCDMWTLSISEQNNNDYYIYNKTDKVITLTHSFAEFLSVFLNDGVFKGLYNWREQIESTIK